MIYILSWTTKNHCMVSKSAKIQNFWHTCNKYLKQGTLFNILLMLICFSFQVYPNFPTLGPTACLKVAKIGLI